MFDKCTTSEKLMLAAVAVLLFPAGPFIALLAVLAINTGRKDK